MFYDQKMSSTSEKDSFIPLKHELSEYKENGVHLYLQGRPSNPFKIAKVCSRVCETGISYMREYTYDDDGKVTEINFNRIRREKK